MVPRQRPDDADAAPTSPGGPASTSEIDTLRQHLNALIAERDRLSEVADFYARAHDAVSRMLVPVWMRRLAPAWLRSRSRATEARPNPAPPSAEPREPTPPPPAQQQLDQLAAQVARTGLFDAPYYRAAGALDDPSLDPAAHYVAVGERRRLPPSRLFDPGYYADRYPDVARAAPSLLLHYHEIGRHQGKLGHVAWVPRSLHRPVNPLRKNVLLVLHDVTRTGAPILGWNIARVLARTCNLFTVRLGDGDLTPAFEALSAEVYGPFAPAARHPVDIDYALNTLLASHTFSFAIINSAQSRAAIQACARRSIPTILLMHEFAGYVPHADTLREAFDQASEIVFPARIVRQAACDLHPDLQSSRRTHVIAQGMSRLPPGDAHAAALPARIIQRLRQARDRGDCIVLNAGTVSIRKGADLFLSIAAAVRQSCSARPLHFVWVGHGFRPDTDVEYSAYLQAQISRCDLEHHLTLCDEVADLEPLYALADIFLLTSRLDPLPNVAIDAILRRLPIVCFDQASGIADFLREDADTSPGVVRYLDVAQAADTLIRLADDAAARTRMAEAAHRRGQALFDMEAYVARLRTLGAGARRRMDQPRRDAAGQHPMAG